MGSEIKQAGKVRYILSIVNRNILYRNATYAVSVAMASLVPRAVLAQFTHVNAVSAPHSIVPHWVATPERYAYAPVPPGE